MSYRLFVFSSLSLVVSSCATPSRPYALGPAGSDAGELDAGPLGSGASDAGSLALGASSSGVSLSDVPFDASAVADSTAEAPTEGAASLTDSGEDAAAPPGATGDAGPDAPDAAASAGSTDSAENTEGAESAAHTTLPVDDTSVDTAGSASSSSAPPACVAETPDVARTVFASPSGTDSAGCGLVASPCQTVGHAIGRAVAAFRDLVVLDDGDFDEVATLQIPGGVTIQGGWSRDGATWQRACANERTSHSTIHSHAGVAVRVSDSGSVHLDGLAIRTKATGDTAESLYGIWVDGAESSLALNEVDVVAGDAGSGLSGSPGATLSGPQTCDTPGTGANGAAGGAGESTASAFTRGGYVAGNGTTGGNGQEGQTGTTGQVGTVLCVPYDGNCNHAPAADYTLTASGGKGGCGGGAGTASSGGYGGGSSVALYVSAGHVVVQGGSFVAGAGGNGGEGGVPGTGGAGKSGAAGGHVACPTQCGQNRDADGSSGGTGGKGGDGGKGGSGTGGNSVALVYASDATVEHVDVTFSAGQAGRGLGDGPLGFTAETYVFTP